MQPRYRVAALVGDLATENDAVRLARSKTPVKQITSGTRTLSLSGLFLHATMASAVECGNPPKE
jgi:Ni2+-binding GTPase involved in maturation of urease and hydrogenase